MAGPQNIMGWQSCDAVHRARHDASTADPAHTVRPLANFKQQVVVLVWWNNG